LRSKSQVNIHVPYIFATPGNHHLDTVLSRSVLEQVIQEDIRQRLVAQLVTKNDNNNDDIRRLSRHMPVPNDMSSLFTSILTQLLESANEMPQGIHHILLVGGASQFPLVQSSLESSVSLLWGALIQQQQLQQQLLIIPTTSVHATELVVLGAATMLPSFTYNVNRGLERATR
jgi:molecular chaperone DnaK (HSP70)